MIEMDMVANVLQHKLNIYEVRFNQILENLENLENSRFKFRWTGPLVVIFDQLSFCWPSWQPFLWFLVKATLQDGWHHVLVEDWPKLNAVQFSLQVSVLNGRAMVVIFFDF